MATPPDRVPIDEHDVPGTSRTSRRLGFAGQPEEAFTDDVALHLARAAGDPAARAQQAGPVLRSPAPPEPERGQQHDDRGLDQDGEGDQELDGEDEAPGRPRPPAGLPVRLPASAPSLARGAAAQDGSGEVNEALADTPETINSDPYGEGWIVKLQPSGNIDEVELLTPDAYQELLDEEEA